MATEAKRLRIVCQKVSKRFGRNWIIKQFDYDFQAGKVYGIRGRNGSGKSTLVRMLAGQLSPSRGTVRHEFMGAGPLGKDNLYRSVSWAGPYLEIVEELTVMETLDFHFSLKPLQTGLNVAQVLERIELVAASNRPLRECSSGMRQRVLLATALYAATPLLLLDEPTLTLDRAATNWFHCQLAEVGENRLVVIATNDEQDLISCDEVTSLQ